MASVPSTSAATSTPSLWATASKEWVIQPKPKPGRKPKKDASSAPKADDSTDGKGRRVQNRAAQRAFRERKQSQLAELQARVLSYEQGEIERNVALQNIAKRLKEENEKLRAENMLLKEKVSALEENNGTVDRKRLRDDSPPSGHATRKRSKTVTETSASCTVSFPAAYLPSPPSMVSSPDSNGTSETRFSPLPYEIHQADPNGGNSVPAFLGFPPSAKQAAMSNFEPAGFPQFDCGFCNEDTPCVCREIAMQQAAADRITATVNLKIEAIEQAPIVPPIERTIHIESPPPPSGQPSILDNLPAYRPPVPLRRRTATSSSAAIFPVVPASQTEATCSGDPANCLACAGDSFGQAFCDAVGKSAIVIAPCAKCPCSENADGSAAPGAACADPRTCNHVTSSPPQSGVSSTDSATMPTNDAWKQLKAHPNVEFSDLELLAEVVARRSKCTGPRVVISPAPGSITPERPGSPYGDAQRTDQQPVLLTDPHAKYNARGRLRTTTPPRLVPEEVLLRCGRQRVREVSTDAVQHALRLLDAKYARS